MSIIDQKEYLKKYLSLGDEKEKNKKRKKRAKVIRNRVNIIDDDIDLPTNYDEVELKEFLTAEDAPQVVGMVDDRPLALRIDDYRKSDKWKLVGSDEELKEPENHIKAKLNKNRKVDHADSDASPVRTKGSPPKKSRDYDSDTSPPRKTRKHYDSDASPPRKSRIFDSRRNEDSLPHKKIKNEDSDASPPRTSRRNDDLDRKPRKNADSDTSPPRKSRKNEDADARTSRRNDLDASPPRKPRKKAADSDTSPPRKSRKNEDADARASRRNDLDASPPRKPRKKADSDTSPPRKSRKNEDADTRISRRNDALDASPSRKPRKKADSDTSPPRKSRKNEDADTRISRRNDDLDASPSRKPRKKADSDTSPPRKSRKNVDADASPPRKSRRNASPPRSKRTRQSRFSDINEATTSTQENDKSTTELANEKSKTKKMTKTLDGKTAGLQYGGDFKKETAVLKKREDEMFENMSAEISGKDAAPIMRDRKTGKIRDLEKEAIAEYEKQQKENVQKEKYDKWGKGLKQVEQRREKVAEELHEMSKPLARYANDEDLEKYLKDQERDGDPMLQYIRKKKRKLAVASGDPVALKPQYDGDFIPNRFGIPPGFRWDGVDRSCGYEKQWFEVQNSKKAVEEEVYKWSTEDM